MENINHTKNGIINIKEELSIQYLIRNILFLFKMIGKNN